MPLYQEIQNGMDVNLFDQDGAKTVQQASNEMNRTYRDNDEFNQVNGQSISIPYSANN